MSAHHAARFTVVIPTYRRPELLARAIASVLSQSEPDFEVVVVDDGGGQVGRLSDARVSVLAHATSRGAAAARNTGIAAARGEFVTFLDDDDEFTPDRLELARRGLLVAPIALCWRSDLETRAVTWNRLIAGTPGGRILEAPIPQLGCAVVRRDLVVPMNETFRVSEDVEWWLRMSERGQFVTVPQVGYLMREHAGERLTQRLEQRLDHRLRLIAEHDDYFSRYPRAAAYQWRRAAGMAQTLDKRGLALECYGRAGRASVRSALAIAPRRRRERVRA